MPAIIHHPTIVEQAVEEFGDLFANAPERRHFTEYLTGLLLAERKTVSGINREFAVTTDQSCLNRWITEVGWDEAELNTRRLAWLQQELTTRYARQGVIAIDNTLVTHEGELVEDVGWFWDHADLGKRKACEGVGAPGGGSRPRCGGGARGEARAVSDV